MVNANNKELCVRRGFKCLLHNNKQLNADLRFIILKQTLPTKALAIYFFSIVGLIPQLIYLPFALLINSV